MPRNNIKKQVDSDYFKIPEATPINIQINPEEIKDIAALFEIYDVLRDQGYDNNNNN